MSDIEVPAGPPSAAASRIVVAVFAVLAVLEVLTVPGMGLFCVAPESPGGGQQAYVRWISDSNVETHVPLALFATLIAIVSVKLWPAAGLRWKRFLLFLAPAIVAGTCWAIWAAGNLAHPKVATCSGALDAAFMFTYVASLPLAIVASILCRRPKRGILLGLALFVWSLVGMLAIIARAGSV